jgi:hypothetical protein
MELPSPVELSDEAGTSGYKKMSRVPKARYRIQLSLLK